jgi:hypothetical protein
VKAEGKIISDEDMSVTNQMTILQLLTHEDLKNSCQIKLSEKMVQEHIMDIHIYMRFMNHRIFGRVMGGSDHIVPHFITLKI